MSTTNKRVVYEHGVGLSPVEGVADEQDGAVEVRPAGAALVRPVAVERPRLEVRRERVRVWVHLTAREGSKKKGESKVESVGVDVGDGWLAWLVCATTPHLDDGHTPIARKFPRQRGQQALVVVDGAAVHARGVLDQQSSPGVTAGVREKGARGGVVNGSSKQKAQST